MSKFRSISVLLVSACAMAVLTACQPQPSAPAVTAPAAADAATDMAEGAMQMDAQDASITQFHARGNEPFWSVTVDGTALTWTTPEMQPGKLLVAERSADADDGIQLTGSDGGKAFTLDIQRTPCQDSMSGQVFEFTATFTYDGEAMTGCAGSGL